MLTALQQFHLADKLRRRSNIADLDRDRQTGRSAGGEINRAVGARTEKLLQVEQRLGITADTVVEVNRDE